MTKIYAQGNYIVIEANNERKTFPKRDVRFKVVDEDGIYSLSSQELPIGDFNYSEVKKEDNSDYATALEFETFLFENTGNFNSGADVSPSYIPLTGTVEGKPIDGDLEFGEYVNLKWKNGDFYLGIKQVDEYLMIYTGNDNIGYSFLQLNGSNGDIEIYPTNNISVGLKSLEDFSLKSPENKLIYAQRSYVERPETLINCLNNATPAQLSTIKSILGIA